MPQYKS